jgi:translation elongation factor P/translation initiation factor 5A
MKFGKAVIVGCLKNSAEFLPRVFQNLEKLASCFDEVSFIFIENDSTDATKATIGAWGAKQSHFKLFSMDGLDDYEKNRTVRLEIARNAYINAIQQDASLHDHEHLIVMDMDDRGAYPLSLDALGSALSFLNEKAEHAAVFANQSVKYYDLWALRHPQLCPFDFWHEVLAQALHVASDQEAFDKVYAQVPKCIPVDTPPIQVESAFGGLGIYKMKFVLNNKSRYIGHEYKYFVGESMVFSKLQTCEHVSFHQGIAAQGGQMFILPYLVNSDQDTGFNPSAFRTIVIQR